VKAGQEKHRRKRLRGCKATAVAEMLSVSGTLLPPLSRFIQVLKDSLPELEMFVVEAKV